MKPQSDPKVDYAFKHVFGREQSKPALISLLDAVLQPASGGNIASIEFLNPFNEKEALDDKLSVLDIKARDESGRQFNIEMQMLVYGAFRPRALYYWSRLHQGQLHEGDDYGLLRPTIAVCFVDTPLFPEIPDYHLIFELRERRHQALFTDQMAVHILELAKFSKAVAELTTPLDRWMFFLQHAENLDADALPEPMNVPEVRWALGDLVMISQSDRDRERYESRLKMRRDISTALAEAKESGEAEGWEKGRDEGRVEVQVRRVRSLQRLLRQQIRSPDELKTLSSSELESLAVQLENELNAKLANGS
jgi:predicted transposase/invertase (TIGR01784 family)